MPVDVVECRMAGRYRLWLRFGDGVVGEVDVAELVPFRGVFATLAKPEEFAKVAVDTDLGTVVWPGGADLDPDVLHARVVGRLARGCLSATTLTAGAVRPHPDTD